MEGSSGLAYFIAKAAHSCSNGLLDNFQGVKPIERVSEARNGDQFHEGKERGEGQTSGCTRNPKSLDRRHPETCSLCVEESRRHCRVGR